MPQIPIAVYAIPLADAAARGHIDCGVAKYNECVAVYQSTEAIHSHLRLVVPAATNLALGLELLLKLHHCQQSGVFPRGHDIRVLGTTFNAESMKRLRQIYASQLAIPSLRQALNIQVSGGWHEGAPTAIEPDDDPEDYDHAVRAVGRGYEKWRYFYENIESGLNVRVNFRALLLLVGTMREAVANYKGSNQVSISQEPPVT